MDVEVVKGFPKTIQTALREGKWDYASRLFHDDKHAEDIKNNSWDLIPVITEHLTEKNRNQNNELYKCCVTLLNIISENSNSEEALLQFISEIEEATEDTKFVTLLEPLYKVILRVPAKKVNSLAWSFNAVQTYLSHLEQPDYENFEGKERLLIDNSEPIKVIIRLFSEVVIFYQKFVVTVNKDTDIEVKNVLCKFLVQLLGSPLCFLTMEEFGTVKTDGRLIAEDIVHKVFKASSDPFKLVEMRLEKQNDELITPDLLSTANLFYLTYSEGVCFEAVPKVYSSRYVFECTLPLMYVLLEKNNIILTEKSLKLSQSIFDSIKEQSLSYLLLDCEFHIKFCQVLTNVIVHQNSQSLRKSALAVFTRYLKCFEIRGVYLIISNLMGIISHGGLIGYMITFYKDLLNKEFISREENMSEYFKEQKLFGILRKFCSLPQKEETNIRENSDQIISCLNLLRYLALKDKKNITKFWDFSPILEDMYFKVLRKAIDLSRAHYELEINNLKKEKISKEEKELEDAMTVNGMALPKMSTKEKIQMLSSTLTAFDVINSLLCRVVELIENRDI